MSVNKVMLICRLGQDPEMKQTPNGNAVCNFSVATSEYWKDKSGQKQEKTEWHRIVAWARLAETCGQYLSKGMQVYIEGSLATRSWEKDGIKRYTTEIVASKVDFLEKKQEQQPQQQQQPLHTDSIKSAQDHFAQTQEQIKIDTSDIPF